MRSMGQFLVVVGVLALLSGCVTSAPRHYVVPAHSVAQRQAIIYPAQGQSPQQLDKDRYECHLGAVRQTGFDPSRSGSPTDVRVLVRPGNPPGSGAAVGALAGAIFGTAIAGPGNPGAGLLL